MSKQYQTVSLEQFSDLRARLAKEKTLRFKIASGSMEPVILTGDLIEVAAVGEELSRFDIIVFYTGHILVCHFLWHINQVSDPGEEKILVTRSLTQQVDDIPVARSQMLGRVVNFKLSKGWRFRIFLRAWRQRNLR